MPGRYGGSSGWILIDGFNLTAAKLQALRHKVINVTEPSHGIGDSWNEHAPVGTRQAELVQEGGFFNTVAGNFHDALSGQGVAIATSSIANPSVITTSTPHRFQTGDRVRIQGHAGSIPSLNAPSAIAITSSSVADPTVITAVGHGFATGDLVKIQGHAGSTPDLNDAWAVTVVDPDTFTIPIEVTVGGTGGTVTSLVAGDHIVTVTGLTTFTIPVNVTTDGTGGLAIGGPGPHQTPRVVVLGLAGNVIGRPCLGFEGVTHVEYEVLAERDKLQRANAAYQISGKLEDAVVLHALGAETADANTEGADSVDHTTEEAGRPIPIVSSSVAAASLITTSAPHGLQTGDTVLIAGHTGSTPDINGEQTATVVSETTFTIPVNVTVGGTGGAFLPAKTNAGGAGFLQMTALALGGHTAAAVTIRDSDDDSTYADLVTFTPRTTTGAERVVVSGAVGRYLAHAIDFTGAGSGPSATYLAAFSRY